MQELSSRATRLTITARATATIVNMSPNRAAPRNRRRAAFAAIPTSNSRAALRKSVSTLDRDVRHARALGQAAARETQIAVFLRADE
jgi:hypothetical protein